MQLEAKTGAEGRSLSGAPRATASPRVSSRSRAIRCRQ